MLAIAATWEDRPATTMPTFLARIAPREVCTPVTLPFSISMPVTSQFWIRSTPRRSAPRAKPQATASCRAVATALVVEPAEDWKAASLLGKRDRARSWRTPHVSRRMACRPHWVDHSRLPRLLRLKGVALPVGMEQVDDAPLRIANHVVVRSASSPSQRLERMAVEFGVGPAGRNWRARWWCLRPDIAAAEIALFPARRYWSAHAPWRGKRAVARPWPPPPMMTMFIGVCSAAGSRPTPAAKPLFPVRPWRGTPKPGIPQSGTPSITSCGRVVQSIERPCDPVDRRPNNPPSGLLSTVT